MTEIAIKDLNFASLKDSVCIITGKTLLSSVTTGATC
jgi:hypothetical protein